MPGSPLWLGRSVAWVAATVIGVAIEDVRAVIDALADPETLYVFGVIAARTSKVGMSTSDGTRSTPYVTPFGLVRETSLSRDVVEAAARGLKCRRSGNSPGLRSSNSPGLARRGHVIGRSWSPGP